MKPGHSWPAQHLIEHPMPFATPEEIAVKTEQAYLRFLAKWIRGEEGNFFPCRLRVRLAVDPKDSKGTITACKKLLLKSKPHLGWGYTVHREQVRLRDFGNNQVPRSVTIDTLDDMLRLAKKQDEFSATRQVADRIREELPQLSDWLISSVRSIHSLAGSVEGLIRVTQFFIDHPWPDCYARQIPVPVDTKFIDRHKAILRQWLDVLLPASAIDVNETTFARRFGLRDGQPHRAIRLLDTQLLSELGLPDDELSLPLRRIAALPVRNATVVIVENDLNLLTLPPIPRGIGLRGEGNAVNRLAQLDWLHLNRVLYWGDIDADGFLILSRLRNLFPHVESILMDQESLQHHAAAVVDGNGSRPALPTNLTASEAAVFEICVNGNRRLEQERVFQAFVDQMFARAYNTLAF